jgi:DNA-binding NtrC family response regulator
MTRVLIVGSLGAELGQAARIARARGARVAHAEGVTDALTRARNDGADLIMCDVAFDVGWLVGALAEERIASPLIACGLARDADAAARAIAAGARDFLPLPPEPDLIAAMIEAAAGTEEAPVHRDPLMTALMARAEQVARSEASLLVCGESGTGKEVLARHIHASSRRARGPFVAINCAALPEALLESELFGHEKGAFSGAIAARRGKFEQAEGGTLLLDEIGEMDPRLQAKLLRAIQEREVDRLGGTQPVRVNVRIIAATNRELRAEVAAGRFREDLFFRLNVIELRIPSLRERPGDILPLAERFANATRGRTASRRGASQAPPWRPCSPMPGREMCGNSKTPSIAPCSSRPEMRSRPETSTWRAAGRRRGRCPWTPSRCRPPGQRPRSQSRPWSAAAWRRWSGTSS